MLFHCSASSIVVCFAFSNVNMSFVICATLCTIFLPTSFCLLPSQLDPEILLSSDWYQELLWRLACPTELGDKAVFCWSWVAYYLHKHNYLWRLAVVFGVWEAAWCHCDIPNCFGVSCHASDTQQQSRSFLQVFLGEGWFTFCLGVLLSFFNVLTVTSSKVDNSSAVNVMIESRGRQSWAISFCIKLSKCFSAN